MSLVSYNVKVDKKKLDINLKKDKQYINKELVIIIYKRRIKDCYEKSRTN